MGDGDARDRPAAMDKVVLDGFPVGKRILRLIGNVRWPRCFPLPLGERVAHPSLAMGEPGEGEKGTQFAFGVAGTAPQGKAVMVQLL